MVTRTRLVMEILRTLAAVVAAGVLLLHSGQSKAQEAPLAPLSFNEKTIETLLVGQALAWNGACLLTRTSCKNTPPPRVGYVLLSGKLGVYEVGTRTILVDLRLLGQEVAVVVMVHEMVHYLQARRGQDRLERAFVDSVCRDEKEAHDVTAAFVRMTGIAVGDRRVNEWAQVAFLYKCSLEGRSLIAPRMPLGPPRKP